MRRDRSPRRGAAGLGARFDRVRPERRGGAHFKRRYKSICLQLLEYFINLLQTLTYHPQLDQRARANQTILRKLDQARDQHRRCKGGWLPARNQPLLESLNRDPEEDSEIAETIVLSETESEDPSGPQEREDISGVWQGGRYTSVRVTSSNPLLRRGPASSSRGSSSSTPRTVVEQWDQLHQGTWITPSDSRVKVSDRVVVSIDWHQVLDIKRQSQGNIRPSPPYTLLPEYEGWIRELKSKGVVVIVNSYCCSPAYRDSVQSLIAKYPGLFDYVITTTKRCEEGGKLWALQSIVHLATSRVIHFDDNLDILKEFVDYQSRVEDCTRRSPSKDLS